MTGGIGEISRPLSGRPPVGQVVVGADAGGTSTRVCVVTQDGTVLARGTAGGSNPNSSADTAGSLHAAFIAALDDCGVHASQVAGCLVGMAGAGIGGYPRAHALASRAWDNAGQRAPLEVVPDLLVAFAAGTAALHGSVLVVGTGAAAAAIHADTILGRSDGVGFLLGDEGSAVWIALQGLRAVAAALDGRGPQTVLVEHLATALELASTGPGELSQQLVAVVYSVPPARLGALAPEVGRAAEEGDSVALDIIDRALSALAASLEVVRRRHSLDAPVVLAGGLALSEGYIGGRLRHRVEELTGRAPMAARYCAAGAAAIAMRRAFGDRAQDGVRTLLGVT